jgi:hypothetical protein
VASTPEQSAICAQYRRAIASASATESFGHQSRSTTPRSYDRGPTKQSGSTKTKPDSAPARGTDTSGRFPGCGPPCTPAGSVGSAAPCGRGRARGPPSGPGRAAPARTAERRIRRGSPPSPAAARPSPPVRVARRCVGSRRAPRSAAEARGPERRPSGRAHRRASRDVPHPPAARERAPDRPPRAGRRSRLGASSSGAPTLNTAAEPFAVRTRATNDRVPPTSGGLTTVIAQSRSSSATSAGSRASHARPGASRCSANCRTASGRPIIESRVGDPGTVAFQGRPFGEDVGMRSACTSEYG